EPLGGHLHIEIGNSGQVAAGTIEASYEPQLDRIGANHEYNRDRRGRVFGSGRQRHAAGNDENVNLPLYEFRSQRPAAIVEPISQAVLDNETAAFNEACIPKPVHKSYRLGRADPGPERQPTDHRQLRLRARDEWRGDRHPAQSGNALPPTNWTSHEQPPS